MPTKGLSGTRKRDRWPLTLHGKVTPDPLDFNLEQTANSRNFLFARAARATVDLPRVRKQTTILAQKGLTTLVFTEAADNSPLAAEISHMGDLNTSRSAVLVRPSIAKPANCAGASMRPRNLP